MTFQDFRGTKPNMGVPLTEAGTATARPATALYTVRPFGAAVKEARVGELFESERERARVFRQLRLFRHWPPPLERDAGEAVSFEVEWISCSGVSFLEIKFTRVGWLSHNKNLRVFAWICEKSRTVWIVDGYWKKVNGPIEEWVKKRVARRVNTLRAWLQDNGRH